MCLGEDDHPYKQVSLVQVRDNWSGRYHDNKLQPIYSNYWGEVTGQVKVIVKAKVK